MATLARFTEIVSQSRTDEARAAFALVQTEIFVHDSPIASITCHEAVRIWSIRVGDATAAGINIFGWEAFITALQKLPAQMMLSVHHFVSQRHLITAMFETESDRYLGFLCVEKR
jgi:hypothetical protein